MNVTQKQIREAIKDQKERSKKMIATTRFWRAKKLSVRASNCLAKANIADERALVEKFATFDSLLVLRNCGSKTAEEIWAYLTNSKPRVSNCDWETEITTEPQSVIIPLLDIEVSAHTWKAVQNRPIHQFNWSVRTQNIFRRQGFKTIADIAALSPREWLNFRNFGKTSLTEIQERMRELIDQLQVNPVVHDSGDDPAVESQSVYIPLLDVNVSAQTWETLQKMPVNSIQWRIRTQNVIDQQGLRKLAEIAAFSPREWLNFRNFGKTSLTEIQERMRELIDQLQVNPVVLDPDDEPATEPQSVIIPLLDIEVSAHTWKAVQNRPIHQFNWSVRTQNIFRRQGFKTIADIAELPPKKWLGFRNFGRKSLTEIRETVDWIIANPDALDPEASRIRTLYELGHTIFQRLQTRQREIVKLYYGYGGPRKNLQQIGEVFGLTRERVRQIKESANRQINRGADNHLIARAVSRLLGESIREVLAERGGYCPVESLMEMIRQRLDWGDGEQWIIDWFDAALGEAWMCFGTDDCKIVDGVCHLKSGELVQGFLSRLAARLQRYGYRPLTLEECRSLLEKANATAIDSDRLLAVIASYPALRVYRYGETHIGLAEWTWFGPEKPTSATGRSALIEWYLRMTNEPATAKAIANGIWRDLGHFSSMPFDVAKICEKQPDRFRVGDNGAYGLYLWEEAAEYRQALAMSLSDESLPIERIAEALAPQEPGEIALIVAALNFYRDLFVETMPFEWALKSRADEIEAETDIDYATLTFEDLMPKL